MVLEGTIKFRSDVTRNRARGRSPAEDGVSPLQARSLRRYLSDFNLFQRVLRGLRGHTVRPHPSLLGQVGALCLYVI